MSEKGGKTISMGREVGHLYDAIVVLGASMEWDEKRKRWEFPTIIQKYVAKLNIGKAKAIAVKEVQDSSATILVTGGAQQHPETREEVSRAEVFSQFLRERYKIQQEKVVTIGKLEHGSVRGNVEDTVAYLEANSEILRSRRIAILCPRFQYERAKLMFESNPFFKGWCIALEWLIVEDLLEKRDHRYKKWSDTLYRTPEAKVNKMMEEKGVNDFKEGKYNKPSTRI
jgi:hypothetical protein